MRVLLDSGSHGQDAARPWRFGAWGTGVLSNSIDSYSGPNMLTFG